MLPNRANQPNEVRQQPADFSAKIHNIFQHRHVKTRSGDVQEHLPVQVNRVARARLVAEDEIERRHRLFRRAERLDKVVARACRNQPNRNAAARQSARRLAERAVTADNIDGFAAHFDCFPRQFRRVAWVFRPHHTKREVSRGQHALHLFQHFQRIAAPSDWIDNQHTHCCCSPEFRLTQSGQRPHRSAVRSISCRNYAFAIRSAICLPVRPYSSSSAAGLPD